MRRRVLPKSQFLQPRSRHWDKRFSILTLQAGFQVETFFEKIASLKQLSSQNGIVLLCMYFHFISMRISLLARLQVSIKLR